MTPGIIDRATDMVSGELENQGIFISPAYVEIIVEDYPLKTIVRAIQNIKDKAQHLHGRDLDDAFAREVERVALFC